MSITISRIAKDLKIAVSTVSKALSDSHEISEETKHKVQQYARKLNYKPNPYAGSLKNGKTKNVAIVLPEVADTFFSNAINGIESIAQNKGYHVMVYQTHENSELEASILNELLGGRVDGVLISVASGVEKNSRIHTKISKKIPTVFFDRVCEEVNTAKVLTNDFESSYNATQHLINRGCNEIIFLSAAANLSIVNQRRSGVIQAMADNNMTNFYHVIQCSEDEMQNSTTIKAALRNRNVVYGVVASVEKLALLTYSVCRSCELNIPKNVKIIAFSNLPIASMLAPPLSTVVQPAFEMGKKAAELLFKALAKKVDLKNESVVVPSVLYERDSTAY